MSTVETIVTDVAKPVTAPLTEIKPGLASFVIGGFASKPIDAVAVKAAGYMPPIINNPLVVGFAQLGAAYALSTQKTKNKYVQIAKTGVEIGAAVAGAQNIVLAGQNFINSRQSTKATVKTAARRVF